MMTSSITCPTCTPNTPGSGAVFSIGDGEVLAGELPSGKARLVQAWIEIRREELLADWELAVNGEEVFKIEPLR